MLYCDQTHPKKQSSRHQVTTHRSVLRLRIKASEMEQMFNLSANGIRLYEKHGILQPRRSEEGNYRLYDQNEMQAMGCSLQYRRYGFTLQQTAELLTHADERAQIDALRAREGEIDAQIDRLYKVRKSLSLHALRAEQALSLLDRCTVEEKPAMYFLGSQRGESFSSKASPAMIGEWIARYAPHLSAAMLLDGPYFVDDAFDAEPLFGVAVDAEVAIALGLQQSEYVTYLPPKACVVTAFRCRSSRFSFTQARARIAAYASAHQLSMHGGGLCRLVLSAREDGAMMDLLLLWAVIKHDERQFGEMR